MPIVNNVIKIKKQKGKLTSSYVENELIKAGYENILRWSIVEITEDFYKINFCSF